MNEKFIIYFGFPSTDEMLKNVENFAANTKQSLENAWIDLIHSFMSQYTPFDGEDLFIPTLFSEVYEMQVIPPPYEQQKYPELLGKTKFRLPAISFKSDYVTCKATGEKVKIKDEDLEHLCNRLMIWVDVKEVSYAWAT
jgi:hypothetical protein